MTNLKGNFITLIFGIFLSLMICEIILQIYNPLPAVVKGDRIILRANYKGLIVNDINPKLPAEIVYSGNSLGFRGPELPGKQAFKILTVGGSTTHSNFLPDNATWSFLISENFRNQYENIWLNNAGIDGHSTYGHTILMQDIIVPLKPEMIIFLIGVNDIELAGVKVFQHQQGNIKQYLINNSELVGLLLNIYRVYKAKENNLINDLSFDLKKFEHINISDDGYAKRLNDQSTYLQGFKERLSGLINISRENNILPVLITQPLLVGDLVDPTTGVDLSTIKYGESLSGKLLWEIMERYNSVTKKVGADNNVHVIDLANSLQKDSKYFRDFMHFTPEGAEKIAEILTVPLQEILNSKGLRNKNN
jgi:lysophospholipase L1-like esterase